MKKWADQGRKPANFQVGDLVLVKLQPTHLKFFRRVHKGLVRKYEGPFPITERVGAVAYKLQLPRWFRVHPVFHANLLKPFHADRQDLSWGLSARPPPNVIATEKRVDAVLVERVRLLPDGDELVEFLVTWKGQPPSEASWELAKDLSGDEDKIQDFKQQQLSSRSRGFEAADKGGPRVQVFQQPRRQPP